MYFITTKRMLEVCFFQHTPTFIIEPKLKKVPSQKLSFTTRHFLFSLLHRHTLRQIPRLIHIQSLCDRYIVSQQLQRDHRQTRRK